MGVVQFLSHQWAATHQANLGETDLMEFLVNREISYLYAYFLVRYLLPLERILFRAK